MIEEENSLLENSTSTMKSMESRDIYPHLIHLRRMGLLKGEIDQLLKQQEICYLRMMYQRHSRGKKSIQQYKL